MIRRIDPARLYLLVEGVTALVFGIAWTIFSLYLIKDVHLDPLQLVLVGTVLEATAFFCEIPTGIVADVYSRRLSVIIGYLLLGAGFLLLGLTTNFVLILLSQVIAGVGFTFISGAFAAWLTDEVGEDRVGDIFLRSSQIGTIAGLAGTGMGVWLATVTLALPLVLAGAMLIALAGLMVVIMPEHNFSPIPREAGQGHLRTMLATATVGLSVVRGRSLALVIVLVGFFLGLFSEGPDRLWEAHILGNFRFPAIGWDTVVWFGIVRAVGSILAYFAAGYARKRVNTSNNAHLIQALFVISSLMTGALFGFAIAGNFLLVLVTKEVFTISRSVLGPLYDTWINQNLESRVRATVLSFSSQLDALGQFAGGPAIGAVGTGFGVRAALLFATSLLLPVPLLFAYANRRQHPRPIMEAEVTP